MTTHAKRASVYERNALCLLEREWRRTGMPGEVRADPNGVISACLDVGACIKLTSPASVVAVLEHLPAAKNANETVVRVLQRILVERVHDVDYGDSAAALDVLRPRVMSVLRKELVAARALAVAFRELTNLDAYVAAVKARMDGSEPSDSLRETGDESSGTPLAESDERPCLTADLGERVALLFYAEQMRTCAASATVGFWDLVCEELAASVRAALGGHEQQASRGEVSSLSQRPGSCTPGGAGAFAHHRADGSASREARRG